MTINARFFYGSAQFLEGLVDVVACFSATLHVLDSISAGKIMRLLGSDLPGLQEITLIAEEEDSGLLLGGVVEVVHPLLCLGGCVHTSQKESRSSREKTTRTPWEFL